jgi:hypothetical protein
MYARARREQGERQPGPALAQLCAELDAAESSSAHCHTRAVSGSARQALPKQRHLARVERERVFPRAGHPSHVDLAAERQHQLFKTQALMAGAQLAALQIDRFDPRGHKAHAAARQQPWQRVLGERCAGSHLVLPDAFGKDLARTDERDARPPPQAPRESQCREQSRVSAAQNQNLVPHARVTRQPPKM